VTVTVPSDSREGTRLIHLKASSGKGSCEKNYKYTVSVESPPKEQKEIVTDSAGPQEPKQEVIEIPGPPEITIPQCTSTFTDTVGHWAATFVEKLSCEGAIQGRSKEVFDPNAHITRAELIKIALLAFGHSISSGESNIFPDLPNSHWAKRHIITAHESGFINGFPDRTVRPDENVTRAEALKIIFNSASIQVQSGHLSPFEDVSSTSWYKDLIAYAHAIGVVNGITPLLFSPDTSLTRAEAAKMILKVREFQDNS